jgi:hypothetical protein
MKKVVKIVAGSLWALPVLAFAQNVSYISNLITQAKALLDQLTRKVFFQSLREQRSDLPQQEEYFVSKQVVLH